MPEGQASVVSINIQDADKIVTAASKEAFFWYKELSKAHPDTVQRRRILPRVEFVKPNTRLQVTIDMIDDEAEGYANGFYLNGGNDRRPIKEQFTVRPGPNVVVFSLRNTGSGRYRARFDIRTPGRPDPFAHLMIDLNDNFQIGAPVITRFYMLQFDAR